jgi:GntR family transcriptional regulator
VTTATPRGEAAYLALARELRTAILENRYSEGEPLPTEAALVASHQVSRQTVRHAMQTLVAEGMIYRVPGRGTFPAPKGGEYLRHFGSVEDLMGLSLDTTFELLTPLQRRVDPAAANRLLLRTDSVVTVTFRRSHGGIPFCFSTVHLPPATGSRLFGIPALTDEGFVSDVTVIGLIEEYCNLKITEAEQSIFVARLPAHAAEMLNGREEQSVLCVDRIYFDTSEHPVELALSYFLPELYSYRVRLHRGMI